jgi:hypothetical protein
MQIVLAVLHYGDPKMVGKVFGLGGGYRKPPLIFLHQETGGGSQAHTNLDSPGGVDVCVLDYLTTVGVVSVHFRRAKQRETLVAPLSIFDQYAPVQRSDGRERRYLPFPFWERHLEIGYRDPWIEDTLTLDPKLDPTSRTRVLPGSGIIAQTYRLPGF